MPYLIVSWFELNNIVHAPGIYFKKNCFAVSGRSIDMNCLGHEYITFSVAIYNIFSA